MDSLRNRGLIRVIGADGGPERVVITSEGMAAIGVEPEATAEAPGGRRHGRDVGRGRRRGRGPGARHRGRQRGRAGQAQAGQGQGQGRQDRAGHRRARGGGEPAAKPTPRAGTKQALMIEMLKRPEGATVEQIAEATGWQHHTIRGAISGALKKKLGLTVEATRTREVGPNKTGAKGSTTVYQIRMLRPVCSRRTARATARHEAVDRCSSAPGRGAIGCTASDKSRGRGGACRAAACASGTWSTPSQV